MIKQRSESIDIYKKNNRKDLLEIEEQELEILSEDENNSDKIPVNQISFIDQIDS